MSVFAISDLHLPGAGKSMDIFGPRWQNHVKRLEDNWRAVVGGGDTVVLGGDISWAQTEAEAVGDLLFLDSLPGEKLLLEGNHDYWWHTTARLESLFAENGITTMRIMRNNAFERNGFALCGTRGWFSDEAVQRRAFDADFNKLIAREAGRLAASVDDALALVCGDAGRVRAFLHFPASFGGASTEPILNALSSRGVGIVYFGHIHGVYSYPPSYTAGGVEHRAMAADYLRFVPRLVK